MKTADQPEIKQNDENCDVIDNKEAEKPRSEPDGESHVTDGERSRSVDEKTENGCLQKENEQLPAISITESADSRKPSVEALSGGSASSSSMDDFIQNDDGCDEDNETGNDADVDENDTFDTNSLSSVRVNSAMKQRATQKTMNFVYRKTSMSSAPDDDDFTSPMPSFKKSERYTGRRPSGVPPPVRAAKEGDVMTKFATGKLSFGTFQELGEEEEED